MKTCPACGNISSDDKVFCGICAENLTRVPAVPMGEAIRARTELLNRSKPVRAGRTSGLAAVIVGSSLLLVGIVLLFVLGNVIGLFMIIPGFLVIGALTGLYSGAPYHGRGGIALNRSRRRMEDLRRRRETKDN